MKKKLPQFLMMYIFTLYSGMYAQENCKTEEGMESLWELSPEAYQEYQNFNQFTKDFITNEGLRKNASLATYTIPVVFHVYGTVQNGDTVDYNTIVNSVNQVNEEFQGLNADFNTVDPMFNGLKSTMSIEFKLATIDPNGNVTNGVVFHGIRNGYGNNDGGTRSSIALDAWDNYKYMNVYIQGDLYNNGVSNNSGVAWLPSTVDSNANVARVVYNGQYLTGNTSNEFASTLTHEFGHWLNLRHTHFNGCGGDDFVSDTPQEDTAGGTGCVAARNCNNDFINYENYMGYNGASGCYKMFTQGQIDRMLAALQHSARVSLWQPQNLIDTGTDSGDAIATLDTSVFKEEISNTGGIETEATITVTNTNFNISGVLVEGTHYIGNIPDGLTARIEVNDTRNEATIFFTGNAINHESSNTTSRTITFLDAGIVLTANTLALEFEFVDPYEIVYVDVNDLTVNTSDVWEPFTDANIPSLGGGTNYGGLFYNLSGHPSGEPALQFETYTAAMITVGATKNIAMLAENSAITTTSNWVSGGNFPNLHDIRTNSYTDWDGQTAYAGFRFTIDNREYYGWFQFSVNGDGTAYSLLDYAYNTEPFGEILTGQQVLATNDFEVAEKKSFEVYPNPFTNTIQIEFSDVTSDSIIIEIYNTLGMKVYKEVVTNGSNTIRIENELTTTGIYFMKIFKNGKNIGVKRIVKK